MPLPVNCLSQRLRCIILQAVANQRMLHPALLTFMWGVVKGKKGEKGGMGEREQTRNRREKVLVGKIILRLTEIRNINELQQRKGIATTFKVHDSQNSDMEVDLSPVYFWVAAGSGAVCLQSCAENGGPAL